MRLSVALAENIDVRLIELNAKLFSALNSLSQFAEIPQLTNHQLFSHNSPDKDKALAGERDAMAKHFNFFFLGIASK